MIDTNSIFQREAAAWEFQVNFTGRRQYWLIGCWCACPSIINLPLMPTLTILPSRTPHIEINQAKMGTPKRLSHLPHTENRVSCGWCLAVTVSFSSPLSLLSIVHFLQELSDANKIHVLFLYKDLIYNWAINNRNSFKVQL